MLQKLRQTCKAVLLDEGGQTMLEYIVIVVFVVIAVIVIYKIVMPLGRGVAKASSAIQ